MKCLVDKFFLLYIYIGKNVKNLQLTRFGQKNSQVFYWLQNSQLIRFG